MSRSTPPAPREGTVHTERARRAMLAALVLGPAVALGGCGVESVPLVTVFSPGSGSITVEPQCWSPDEEVSEQDCANTSNLGRIQVQPGATIGINVDPPIAELGWVPTVDGERLVAANLDGTYYRFALSESDFAESADSALEVYAVDAEENTRGLWVVQLTRR
jgi:hypothetical protein